MDIIYGIIALIVCLSIFATIGCVIFVFIREHYRYRDVLLKETNREAYLKKKGLIDKAPIRTQMGTFVYDPETEDWTCTLKSQEEQENYSFASSDFNPEYAEKLFRLSQQERILRNRFKEYMLLNWDGAEPIKDVDYLGADCDRKGALSISYSVKYTDDNEDIGYGITIDLDENYQPIGHMWYD